MKLFLLVLISLAASLNAQFDGFDGPYPYEPVLPAVPLCRPLATIVNSPTVCGCYDPGSGHHDHDESWVSGLRWKMRCNNGTIEIEACVGSRRANYVEVPINKTVTVAGFWHKCEDTDNNIRYTQEPSCVINGQEMHLNDTFRQNNFKLACESWGYSIRGCYYNDLDGNEVSLDVGQTKDEDIYRHYCEAVPASSCNGCRDKVRYRVQAVKCKQGTKIYAEGETWTGKNLKYLCKTNGAVRIINCVTNNGTEIGIDQAVVIDNILHKCYRIGNTVYYQANSCGFGPACQGGALAVPPYIHYPPTNQGEWPLVFTNSLSGNREGQFEKPPF